MSDAPTFRRRFRQPNVINYCCRECETRIVDISLSGRRMMRERTDIAARRGLPRTLIGNDVTELTSHAAFAQAF